MLFQRLQHINSSEISQGVGAYVGAGYGTVAVGAIEGAGVGSHEWVGAGVGGNTHSPTPISMFENVTDAPAFSHKL